MDLASVVAALASVGVRVSGSTPNNNVQGDSSRACPTGFAGPEPSGTTIDPGQHFHYACTLPPSLSRSSFPCLQPTCLLLFTYFLVGPLPSCTRLSVFMHSCRTPFGELYSLYLATPKSRRVILMRPCHATYMPFPFWVMHFLHLATPKSRRVILMLSCHTLFIVAF